MTNQTVSISQRFVPSGKLQLWTESFGNPGDPAALLIMGAWNQGIVWPDDFCTEIARQGYYVIRYDHRDTGQSSSVNFVTAPYDLSDLARDAIAVLDGHAVHKAHIVGMSMGGFVGQLLALDYPDRILTLALLMTSPSQGATVAAILGQQTKGPALSGPSPRVLEYFARTQASPPKSGTEAIQNVVAGWRIVNGEGVPFDEPWTRHLVERAWARSKNPTSAFHHTLAMAASSERWDRLREIAVPTLVIHGARSPPSLGSWHGACRSHPKFQAGRDTRHGTHAAAEVVQPHRK